MKAPARADWLRGQHSWRNAKDCFCVILCTQKNTHVLIQFLQGVVF